MSKSLPPTGRRRRVGLTYTTDALEPRRLLSTVVWTNEAGTNLWNVHGNWSTYTVPTAGDDVVIPAGFGPINIPSGVQSVRSVNCASPVNLLAPGELDVGAGGATFSAALTTYGGTIRGGTFQFTNGAVLNAAVSDSTATLVGVTFSGTVNVVGGPFNVLNNLTVNGTVLLGHPVFVGNAPQSLMTTPGGSARVLVGMLENQTSISAAAPWGEPITIGAGVTIDGSAGIIGTPSTEGHGIINQGTITADAAGAYSLIIYHQLINQGTLSASNGGKLSIVNLSGPLGTASLDSGGSLTLDGDYTINNALTVGDAATLTLNGKWINASAITVNGGAVNFGGDFSVADLGTLDRSPAGGSFNISGTLDNTGTTLSVPASLGPFRLNGGTIRGGRVDGGSTPIAGTPNGGTLDGVIYRGTLDLGQAGWSLMNVIDGLTVDGQVVVGNPAGTTFGRLSFIGTAPQTLDAPPGATAEVIFGGNPQNELVNITDYNNGYQYGPGESLSLGSGVSIDGKNGNLYGVLPGNRIINRGHVSASVTGGKIVVYNPLVNQGVLSVSGGAALNLNNVAGDLGTVLPISDAGTLVLGGDYTVDQPLSVSGASGLTLGGNWHSAASITSTDSTVTLDGSFASADVDEIHRSGGSVKVTGTDDNADTTLDLNSLGAIEFFGRIVGGVVNGSVLTPLLTGYGGTFDGVSFDGKLQGDLRVLGDLTVNGTMNLGNLAFANRPYSPIVDHTLSGNVTVVLNKGTIINDRNSGMPFGALTLGAGVTITGSGTIDTVGGKLVNSGKIIADGPSAAIYVSRANPFLNQGILTAVNGGLLNVSGLSGDIGNVSVGAGSSLVLQGSGYSINVGLTVPAGAKLELDGGWSNSATIDIADGTLNLGGNFTRVGLGTVTRSPSSTINLTGTLDNTGHALTFDASTGSWNFLDGQITGGRVIESDGQGVVFVAKRGGTLDGVNFKGDLDLSRVNGTSLGVADGLTLDGSIVLGNAEGTNAAGLFFTGRTSQTLAPVPGGSAKVVMGGSSRNLIANYPFRGIPTTVTFAPGVQIVVQNGDFDEYTNRPAPFVNQGSLTILQGGAVRMNATMSNAGTLALGGGATLAMLGLTNDGTISLAPASTLSVVGEAYYGGFTLGPDGTVLDHIGAGSSPAFGQIKVSYVATLGGTLEVDWADGTPTTPGATLPVVTAFTRTGTFSNFVVSPASMAGLLRLQYTGYSAYLLEGGHVVNASAADGPITLSADPNGTDIDWVMGATRGFFPVADPKGLTVGGAGVLNLDYSAGRPLPAAVHLNGTFTINGLRDLSGTTLDLGKSTVYINYAGAGDPVGWIRSALQAGYNGGNWGGVATGTAGVITTSAGSADYGIGYADAADGTGVDRTANTVELKCTLFGDANLDGRVDVADLLALVHNHGKLAAWDDGDFNYDGVVDSSDRRILLDQFTHRRSRR